METGQQTPRLRWEPAGELLERGGEVAVIAHHLGTAMRGGRAVALVVGPAGVGKTSLLEVACGEASGRGMQVHRATGSQLETTVPFGVARALLADRLQAADAGDRAVLLRGAAGMAEAVFDPAHRPPRDEHGFALVQGLGALVRHLAELDGPLLVAVDDLQWVDEGTLRLCAYLATHGDDLPLALVATCRAGHPTAKDELLEALRGAPATTVLRPAPLSASAVAAVLGVDQETGDSAEFVEACARVTGGNPFLLRELLAELRRQGVTPDAAGAALAGSLVPERVVDAVVARLHALGDDAVALARALAVLGDAQPLRRPAALAGLDALAAERSADRLAGVGLLEPGEPVRFAHPLTSAAVAEDIPAFERARAHRHAADLLAAEHEPVERVASHLLAARPDGDAAVVATLRAAAQRARERGDPGAAVRFLQRALDEPPPAEELARVLVELGRAETADGALPAREHLAHGLALMEEPRDRASALLDLARLRHLRLDLEGAFEAAEGGLRALGHDGLQSEEPADPLARDLHSAAIAAAVIHAPLRPRVAAAVGNAVVRTLAGEPPSDPALRALVALTIAADGRRPDVVRHVVAEALRADPLVEPESHGAAFSTAAAALLGADDLPALESAATAAVEAAEERGDVLGAAAARLWRAQARAELGRLAEAVVDGEAALGPRALGWEGTLPIACPVLANIYVEQGRLDDARRVLDLAGGDLRELALLGRALLAYEQGDPRAALEDALAAGDMLEHELGARNAALCPWRAVAVVAALATGDLDLARQLASTDLGHARATGLARPIGVALRNAALAHADRDVAVDLLREAVAVLRPTPARLQLARSLVELGALLRRAGDRVECRDPLREALDLARSFPAPPLVARARDELRLSGARPRRAALTGLDALTPSELRIAVLAAEGLSNQEIAHRLYLSRKTVEGHLSRAFQKLGVDRRAALRGLVGVTPDG